MLMPIAVIGSYFKVISDVFFSPNSLIYNLFNFDYIMSDQFWDLGNSLCTGMIQVTYGLFGIYVAYFAAMYTARIYHKDATMAGLTSVIVICLCAYLTSSNSNNSQLVFYSRILNINGMLIALIIGYSVGQIFHWLGKKYVHIKYEHVEEIQQRAWNSIFPTIVTLVLGAVLAFALYYFKIRLLDSSYIRDLSNALKNSNNIAVVIPLTMLGTFAWWCGVGYPVEAITHSSNANAALMNLNYALRHGSAANVPYKYLGSSLVQSYGLMGDAAISFALTVVFLLYTNSKQNNVEKVVKLNLLPVVFGTKSGLAVGIPLVLNPLYFIPIVFIPAINELLAAVAITINLIKPAVYPVLGGTPGILISFFGTNGDWITFIFTICLFIIDTLVFIPFVKIGYRINEELQKYDQKAEI